MNVAVKSDRVTDPDSLSQSVKSGPPLYPANGLRLFSRKIRRPGVMKLMPLKTGPHLVKRVLAVYLPFRVAVALRLAAKLEIEGKYSRHFMPPAVVMYPAAKIDGAAAFRVYRQSAFRPFLKGTLENMVPRQKLGMGLRKSSAHVKGVNIRKLSAGNSAHENQLGAFSFQGLQVFGVIKGKSRITDDPDFYPASR
jgi:hypothetical protein